MSNGNNPDAVVLPIQDGVATIEKGTPLTRLNYFDGKFLRADDLLKEQKYFLAVSHLSNRAGGYGIANGLDLKLEGAELRLLPGMAINPDGELILLSGETTVAIDDLIARTTSVSATGSAGFGDCAKEAPAAPKAANAEADVYLITIAPAEGLCGQEDVYGKLCEAACVTDSQRPYKLEGVVLRARKLVLDLPTSRAVPVQGKHLRSRIAAAYFANEPGLPAARLDDGGLLSGIWCAGASLVGGKEIALGVLARNGASNLFVDAWTARRERMDAQAKGYWQGRLRMRPWNVFLAHILQFQCQLPNVIKGAPVDGGLEGGCRELADAVAEATLKIADIKEAFLKDGEKLIKKLIESGAFNEADARNAAPPFENQIKALDKLHERIHDAAKSAKGKDPERILIDGGIIELPSAGYLPVAPHGALTVNRQVRALLGDGVDLRFCVVPPDYVAHALEEAQHMDRISLTQGLDDPASKPKLEIYVPDGVLLDDARLDNGIAWEATLAPQGVKLFPALFGSWKNVVATMDVAGDKKIVMYMSMTKKASGPTIERPFDTSAPDTAMLAKPDDGMDADGPGGLRGMARTVGQGQGGAALYFLGAAQRGERPIQTDDFQGIDAEMTAVEDAVAAARDQIANAIEKMFKTRQATDPAKAAATPRRASRRTAKAVEPSAESAAEALAVSQQTGQQVGRPLAVWLEMKVDGDPCALDSGERTGVSFELRALRVLYSKDLKAGARAIGACTVMRGHGSLRVDGVEKHQPSRPRIKVRLDISGDTTTLRSNMAAGDRESVPFSSTLDLWVAREGDAAQGRLRLEPIADSLLQRIWLAEWGGSPRLATFGVTGDTRAKARSGEDGGAIRPDGKAGRLPLYASTGFNYYQPSGGASATLMQLTENAAVLSPDYPDRPRWLDAIGAIAEASEDSGFIEYAKRKLLGEVVKSTEVGILAKREWVMFRRARTAICAGDAPLTPPVRRLHYATYHLAVKTADQLKEAAARLMKGELPDPKQGRLVPVDVLSFADESVVAEQTQANIAADWSAAHLGGVTLFAGVWARDLAVGPPAVQRGRLKFLLTSLAGLSSNAGLALETLPGLASELDDGDNDGVMILISREKDRDQEAKDSVHRFYLANNDYSSAGQLRESFNRVKNDSAKLVAFLKEFARELGVVHYSGTTAKAAEAGSVVARAKQIHVDESTAQDKRRVLLHAGAANTPDAALDTQSRNMLHELLGTDAGESVIIGGATALADLKADAISVFFPVHIN